MLLNLPPEILYAVWRHDAEIYTKWPSLCYATSGIRYNEDLEKHGTFKYWNVRGVFKSIEYKNDVIDGTYRQWLGGGRRLLQYTYKNGLKHGEHTQKDDDVLVYRCMYKDNKRNGEYTEWYKNGNIKQCGSYTDDLRDGLYKQWGLDGNQSIECNYKNGYVHGLYKEWSSPERCDTVNVVNGVIDDSTRSRAGILRFWRVAGLIKGVLQV
mmetsp:Transcript_4681/g.5074  ORF Transcript_4681/g.5074 Transcript_4681/m.5074 type:complete len:210 (-) Transcript_4681:222-851(-)